jgi:Glycosyltransferase 61
MINDLKRTSHTHQRAVKCGIPFLLLFFYIQWAKSYNTIWILSLQQRQAEVKISQRDIISTQSSMIMEGYESISSISREAPTVMEELSITSNDSTMIVTDPIINSSDSSNIMDVPSNLSSEQLISMEGPNKNSTESLMMTEDLHDISTESLMATEEFSNLLLDSSTVMKKPNIISTETSPMTEESSSKQDLAANDQSPICVEMLTSQFRATQFPYDKDTYKHDVINDRTLLVEKIISSLTDVFNFAAPVDENMTISPENDEDALFKMNAKSYFSSRVAVCEFVHDWISHHPPHALQQILRCMSYWRTRQLEFEQSKINAERSNDNKESLERNSMESSIFLPVLIWPAFAFDQIAYSKAKSFRRMNKSHGWRQVATNEFTIGILDEIATEFDVLITTPDIMENDVYHRLLQIEKFQYQQFMTASGENDNFTNPYDNKMYYGHDKNDHSVESYSILGSDYNRIKVDDSLYYLSDVDYNEISSDQEQENDHQIIASKSYASLPELTSKTLEILRQVLIEATVTSRIIDHRFDSYAVHNAPSDVHYYTDRIKSKYNFALNSQLIPKIVYDNFHSLEAAIPELNRSDTEVTFDMEQNSTMCEQIPIIPRIGILNRRPENFRSLLNVDAIVNALENELLYMNENIEHCYRLGKISKPTVNVAYFEGVSFQSQIEFYSSVDIILTPHGAQETGLFFMPRCGAILEFFPKGYHIPWFFGNLARMSGIAHYSGYISNTTDIGEDLIHGFDGTPYEQSCARYVNLCPQIPPISDYMMNSIVQDWQKCMIHRRSTRYDLSHDVQ